MGNQSTSALDGEIFFEEITDLDQLARIRADFASRGIEMPLQPAEIAAGLTEPPAA